MKLQSFFLLFTLLSIHAASVSARGIVKRRAGGDTLYVYANMTGCVSVTSTEPCPVNAPLNPYAAKQYEALGKAVNVSGKSYKSLGLSGACIRSVKSVLCSQGTARCYKDGSQDYGDARKTCEDTVYTACPTRIVQSFKQNRVCENLMTGKHDKKACVAPSRPMKGVCPQPKYKMPEDFLTAYQKKSETLEKLFNQWEKIKLPSGNPFFSPDCLTKLREFACSPVYCSTDEKYLLTQHDQDDCKDVMDSCLEKHLNDLSGQPFARTLANQLKSLIETTCKSYPKNITAQVQSVPTTSVPTTSVPTTSAPTTSAPPTVAQSTSAAVQSQATYLGVLISLLLSFIWK